MLDIKSAESIEYAHRPDAPPGTPPLAARAGDLIFVGGQMAAHPVNGVPAEAKLLPGYRWHGSSIEKQLNYLYDNLDKTLQQLGSSLHHIMKINSYHLVPPEINMALRIRKEWFGAEPLPPSTLVVAQELPLHGPTALIDMVTLAADSQLGREVVDVKNAPVLGHLIVMGWAPFARALRGGGFIFTAGKATSGAQGPLPEILPNDEFPYRYHQIRFQTEYVLKVLKAILADGGCSLDDVVRAEVHLADMRDLATLDEIWREFFPNDPPARVIIPIGFHNPALLTEIEFIAVDPKGPYRKEVISTPDAPQSLSPESQAVKAGPYVFLSGQLATDYRQGVPPEARPDPNFPYHSSPVKRQVEYILKNVEAICRASGSSLDRLVKRRVHHLDLNEMAEAENVWRKRLGDRLPPTSTLRVNDALPVPGCTIQYDLIAVTTG